MKAENQYHESKGYNIVYFGTDFQMKADELRELLEQKSEYVWKSVVGYTERYPIMPARCTGDEPAPVRILRSEVPDGIEITKDGHTHG